MKKSVFFLALFIYSLSAFNQNLLLQKDSSNTKIIGIGFINGKSVFLSFDYTTGITDTLFSLNDTIACFNSAYDPYRRLFFYYKIDNIGNTSNLWQTAYYAVDLNTGQRDSLFSIVDSSTHLAMEYDIFTNNLLIRMGDKLLGFNMVNRTIDTLMSIPFSNAIYSTYADFFDYKNRIYTYRMPDTSYSIPDKMVRLDLKTYTVDSIYSFTNLSLPGDGCYNIDSNNFYAFRQDNLPGNISSFSIAKVNPATMTWNTMLVLPGSIYSHLNQQKASFDASRGLYLLPYINTSTNINYLLIFDISTNTFQLKHFNFSNNNYLDNNPNPLLVLRDSALEACYSVDYTWFYNGTLISGASQQHYLPQNTGWYKFSTHRPDGSTVFSNEVYVIFNSVKNLASHFSLNIYPNPVHQFVNIEMKGDVDPKTLNISIFNTLGQSISEHIRLTTTTSAIDLSSLPQGIYYIRISDALGNSAVRTIIKK